MELGAITINGPWRQGFAISFHKSNADGDRTPIGELLYQLKYHKKYSLAAEIAKLAAGFYEIWAPGCTLVVPAPSSKDRQFQPTTAVSEILARTINLPCDCTAIVRTRKIPEIKHTSYADRIKMIAGIHEANPDMRGGHSVLLVDDIYDTGATMTDVANCLFRSSTSPRVENAGESPSKRT